MHFSPWSKLSSMVIISVMFYCNFILFHIESPPAQLFLFHFFSNGSFFCQEQIVGSPNIPGPMANYNTLPYVTGSPQRHRTVHASQPPQQPINHQASRFHQPHNQMQPMGVPVPLHSSQQAYHFSSQPQVLPTWL